MIEDLGFNRKSVIFWTLLFWVMQIGISFWSTVLFIVLQVIYFVALAYLEIGEEFDGKWRGRSDHILINQSFIIVTLYLFVVGLSKIEFNLAEKVEKFNNWLDGKQKDDSCPLR
jgi:hypothetical protein